VARNWSISPRFLASKRIAERRANDLRPQWYLRDDKLVGADERTGVRVGEILAVDGERPGVLGHAGRGLDGRVGGNLGTDLSAVSQYQLDTVAKKLNTRPRETPNWRRWHIRLALVCRFAFYLALKLPRYFGTAENVECTSWPSSTIRWALKPWSALSDYGLIWSGAYRYLH
jgi:hypothetical protein